MITLHRAAPPANLSWPKLSAVSTSPCGGGRQAHLTVDGLDWIATCQPTTRWGAADDSSPLVIVDLQGMDTMLAAHRMVFDDCLAPAVLSGFGLAEKGVEYRRQGVAGAPPEPDFPGGEVLVDEIFRIGEHGRGAGESWTVAGHLRHDQDTGDGVAWLRRGGEARDLRSIYSHTAVWPRDFAGRSLRFDGGEEPSSGLDVLDRIQSFAREANAPAYAAAIRLTPRDGVRCEVTTRTLRCLPAEPIRDVEQATRLGAERVVVLEEGEQLVAFGTYFPRVEADWERMRGGRPYEARGHFHCAKFDAAGRVVHVAHLREARIGAGVMVDVDFRPAGRVVKVDPVERRPDGEIVRGSDGGPLNGFHANA